MVRRESRPSTIGPITLGTKQTGAPSAGNPHAGCDVAGAGNGFTVWLLRHSQRKRGATARPDLRNTAPVLDPTAFAEGSCRARKTRSKAVALIDRQGNYRRGARLAVLTDFAERRRGSTIGVGPCRGCRLPLPLLECLPIAAVLDRKSSIPSRPKLCQRAWWQRLWRSRISRKE